MLYKYKYKYHTIYVLPSIFGSTCTSTLFTLHHEISWYRSCFARNIGGYWRILEDVSRRQGGEIGARTAKTTKQERYLLEFLTTLKEEDSEVTLEACPRQQEAQLESSQSLEVDVYSLQCAHTPAGGGSLSAKGLRGATRNEQLVNPIVDSNVDGASDATNSSC